MSRFGLTEIPHTFEDILQAKRFHHTRANAGIQVCFVQSLRHAHEPRTRITAMPAKLTAAQVIG